MVTETLLPDLCLTWQVLEGWGEGGGELPGNCWQVLEGGGGRGAGNFRVIVVRVFEPVFGNLLHSYAWPLIKRTNSYTRTSKMLANSYYAL